MQEARRLGERPVAIRGSAVRRQPHIRGDPWPPLSPSAERRAPSAERSSREARADSLQPSVCTISSTHALAVRPTPISVALAKPVQSP